MASKKHVVIEVGTWWQWRRVLETYHADVLVWVHNGEQRIGRQYAWVALGCTRHPWDSN